MSRTSQDILFDINVIACEECGGVNDGATNLLRDLQETVETLKDELAQKLRKIKALQRDGDANLRNSIHYKPAMRVLEHWQSICHPDARELEGDRLRKVIGRLTGKPKPFSEEQLKLAVMGYAQFPYVVDGKRMAQGSPSQRFIDAELIFRDAKHVDQGLALADESRYRALRPMAGANMALVPWRQVRRANHREIVKWLDIYHGPAIVDDDGISVRTMYHCPNQEGDHHPDSTSLQVANADARVDWLVACHCGMNDEKLLTLIREEKAS